MPRSTATSRIFFSCSVLLPRHCVHLSFSLIVAPAAQRESQPAGKAMPASDARTLAPAVSAHHLHLLRHAGRNLAQVDLHALAVAADAGAR